MGPVTIGGYVVSADSEMFRIFPKGRNGKTCPVTRVNHFIYLRCLKSGALVVFKKYLHMKQWFWRDSRDVKPCHELDVIAEVARMLGVGRERAQVVLAQAIAGVAIAA